MENAEPTKRNAQEQNEMEKHSKSRNRDTYTPQNKPTKLHFRTKVQKEDGCFKKLASQYKFYLSFENSICDEYVTEKLTRAFASNVVPIVFGGANYSQITPPNSVINVDNFETIESLANYLTELDHNEVKQK